MKHSQNPINKTVISYALVAIFAFLVGAWVRRIPYIQLDPKLNIGDFTSSLIALIGLAAAIFFLPFIVDRIVSNRKTRDSLIVEDLDEIYKQLRSIESIYKSTYDAKSKVTKEKRSEILHELKIVSNLIKELSLVLDNDHAAMNFNTDIKDVFNEETYKLLTENLQTGKTITPSQYLDASNSVLRLTSQVKSCRYKLYAS